MTSSDSKRTTNNPALNKPAYTPIAANSSVLLAGLMGLRPNNNPAISAAFNTGTTSGLGRRPSLAKRTTLGGM